SVERGIERKQILFTRAFVGRLFAYPVGELVAQDLRHVRHRGRNRAGRELLAYHDPVREAVLYQIVEFLAREASRASSDLTDHLPGNCDLPLLEPFSRFERHGAPRQLSDGEATGGALVQ